MKTILFPTDFSKAANHAIDFAVLLAKLHHARLTLLNVYNVLMPSDLYGTLPAQTESLISQTEMQAQEQMNQLRESLLSKHDYFRKDTSRLETKLVYGFSGDTIVEEAEALKPIAVVMGSKGATSSFEKFFGSVTTAVMTRLVFPLFIIPAEAKLRTMQHICYAIDLHGDETPQIEIIKEFASVLGAEIRILHITKHDEDISKETMRDLEKYYVDKTITFRHLYRNNVIEGLERYITNKKPEILALAITEKGFFEKLFHQSVTRHLALTAKIPLLMLHKMPVTVTQQTHEVEEISQLII
ncbi:MAG: universal stress protein [Verrucomicrobia bacterium]|nr:universal stress protein [Cytophagales bacterium]